MISDDEREKFLEYQCTRCGVHQELPMDAPDLKCVSCNGRNLVRRIVGPLQLRKQIRNAIAHIERLWDTIDKMLLDIELLKKRHGGSDEPKGE